MATGRRRPRQTMNIDAAFNVADLDLVGGHVEDSTPCCACLAQWAPDDKRVCVNASCSSSTVGVSDPRTVKARAALT